MSSFADVTFDEITMGQSLTAPRTMSGSYYPWLKILISEEGRPSMN
jgi:hypothetical protein